MIIEDFVVNRISNVWWSVSWTATDLELTSWLFINGILQGQYSDDLTLERYAEFSVVENTMNLIEIHEGKADDPTTTMNEGDPIITYNKKLDDYDIHWDRVDDAEYYNIYHQEADGVENLIFVYAQEEETEKYILHAPVLNSVDGVWHHFRVEAVDFWNNESTTALWHYFVYGMPDVPSNITITAGSGAGLFNISVIM